MFIPQERSCSLQICILYIVSEVINPLIEYTSYDYHEDNIICPIANYKFDNGQMGVYLFPTKEEAIEAWNRRKGWEKE